MARSRRSTRASRAHLTLSACLSAGSFDPRERPLLYSADSPPMTARLPSKVSVASVVVSLLLASCAGRRVAPRPLKTEPAPLAATMPELLERVSDLARRAPAFTASADLGFLDLASGARKSVKLRL